MKDGSMSMAHNQKLRCVGRPKEIIGIACGLWLWNAVMVGLGKGMTYEEAT